MIDGGSTRHLATVHSSALIAVRNENLPSRSPSMSRYCCMRTDHAVAILSLSLSLSLVVAVRQVVTVETAPYNTAGLA